MRIIEAGRISYLFIMVRDLKRMAAFYRDVLGFAVTHLEEGTCAFLALPGANDPQVALYIGRQSAPIVDDNHWFTVIDVSDLDDAAARAQSMGVRTEGIFEVPYGRALSIADPEGNIIQLHQPQYPVRR
jgi:predicted enzyme related to lactoylglutathione lyase